MKDIKIISSLVVLVLLSLLVIVSTISAELINTPEGVIITHYPSKFDGVGTVYSIDEQGIVIDDMFVSFASQVRYMTPQSSDSSLWHFKPGGKVGYILNDRNQITELCLLPNMKREEVASPK